MQVNMVAYFCPGERYKGDIYCDKGWKKERERERVLFAAIELQFDLTPSPKKMNS